MLVELEQEGRPDVGNAYGRSVAAQGNRVAQQMLDSGDETGRPVGQRQRPREVEEVPACPSHIPQELWEPGRVSSNDGQTQKDDF